MKTLLTSIDSFWFTTDSQTDDIEHEQISSICDKLLRIESVTEVERYSAFRIHTDCEHEQLPSVIRNVYEVLAENNCLNPLGAFKLKYNAHITYAKANGITFMHVHTQETFDWLDMLEDVKKVDDRYTLGKQGASHQTFEIIEEKF